MLSFRLGIGPTISKRRSKSFKGILDSFGNASSAFSLRRVSTTYNGNIIRVRRSSDNSEQEFGFVNNVLDTASLLAFCGSGTGYVTKWFDQSGNNYHLSENVGSFQPRIVIDGVLATVNGKVSIKFFDVQRLRHVFATPLPFNKSTTQSTYGVFRIYDYPGSYFGRIFCQKQNDSVDYYGYTPMQLGGNVPLAQGEPYRVVTQTVGDGTNFTQPTAVQTQDRAHLFSSFFSNGQTNSIISLGLDNQALSPKTAFSVAITGLNVIQIGNSLAGEYERGNFFVSEVLNYMIDNSAGRTQINNDINAYYNIY